MFKQKLQQGFTLIELLVVIAIIGILAATVLAALGTARSSGSDASAISSINSAKAQAELYYTGSTTYDGVCGGSAAQNGLLVLRTAIDTNIGTAGVAGNDSTTQQITTTINCNDLPSAWALSTPLTNGGYFCADSTGFSGKRVTALSAYVNTTTFGIPGGVQCPAT